jgi:hypothetical protein
MIARARALYYDKAPTRRSSIASTPRRCARSQPRARPRSTRAISRAMWWRAVHAHARAGDLTAADMAAYQRRGARSGLRALPCWVICSMGPRVPAA